MNKFEKALSNLQECFWELQQENTQLRAAAAKTKDEVRKDFEKEIDMLNKRLSRAWMVLSPVEDERLRQFRDKHYQLHKKDNGFIPHIFGTGIGTCYKIECPICHELEDITDVSDW